MNLGNSHLIGFSSLFEKNSKALIKLEKGEIYYVKRRK